MVDVSFEQVFEDGTDSDFLYDLSEKILRLLDGYDRYPGEAVYRLVMKPNLSLALVSDAESTCKVYRSSSDEVRWRLAVCSKLPVCG